jgi:geranylgeranyl diphosphate synthase, type I
MIADTLSFLESRRRIIMGLLKDLSPSSGELGKEQMSRIVEFCSRGKMIRGCLVFLGAEAAGAAKADVDVPLVAVAMELFQAGLLVHDDIMDRDDTRRGAPTIHARYAAEAEAEMRLTAEAEALAREAGAAGHKSAEALAREAGAAEDKGGAAPRDAADTLHLGESLGICLGDLCYFEGFAALGRALARAPEKTEGSRGGAILDLCSSVLAEVAVAQMSDVRWGSSCDEVPENEILDMYRGKTAHYSFSLPLAAGALCAGAESLVSPLMRLGESLGILFQIRDDELGLFGSEAATGKGIGSDLREGKKTLFRSRLFAAAPPSELPRLRGLFTGAKEAEAGDLAYLRRLSEELGVSASLADMKDRAEEEARSVLRALPRLESGAMAVFEGLVDYVTRREK